MDLRMSSITADILNVLADGKVHKLHEIARKVEVSRITVQRHIKSLSYRYPIETFSGGENKGGVYLDKNYIYQGLMLTNDELQVINQALAMLQNSKGDDVSQEIIINLISKFSLPSNKEYIDNEYCKKIG